jgi:UDP-glucose 4-epimerase
LLDMADLTRSMKNCEIVFHLGANTDVRFGTDHPTNDLHQNTVATVDVLEAMRATGANRIAFASTGSVYGEAEVIPTPENAPFPIQISLHAASKLAAEGFITAYCEGFGIQGFIFRLVSILGERYSQGHVFDFYKQLLAHPDYLDVLGDGKQRKSYLYVQDCIDAILTAIDQCKSRVTVLNLGTNEYCQVTDSIGWICEELGLRPQLNFTGGQRGWIGDNPFMFLDTKAIRTLGWKPKLSIKEGVVQTIRYLQNHPKLLMQRS